MKTLLLLMTLVSPLAFAEKIQLNLESGALPTGLSTQQYIKYQQDYEIALGKKEKTHKRAVLQGEYEIRENFRQQISVFLPTTAAEMTTVSAIIRLTEHGDIEEMTLHTQDAEQAKIFQQAVHKAVPFQLPEDPLLKKYVRNFYMQWPNQDKSYF